MKTSPRSLFKTLKAKVNPCKPDKPTKPPTPPRQDSGLDDWHELMELPSNPGTKTPVQLTELRRLLSKHESTQEDNDGRPERIDPNNRFWRCQTRRYGSRPKPSPALLTIPKKLRAIILTYLLPMEITITVIPGTPRPHEPPILQTTSQLRTEAARIYYTSNTFHFHIHNFDATPLMTWLKTTPDMQIASISMRVYNPEEDGETCWGKLVEWLEAYWRDEVLGMGVSEGPIGPEMVGAARRMFRIVDGLRRVEGEARIEWSQVVGTLEWMREEEGSLWKGKDGEGSTVQVTVVEEDASVY